MESLLATNSTFNSTLLSVVIASTSTASASMLDTTTVSATPLLVTSLTHAAAAISKSIKQSKSIKYNNDFSPVTLAGDWSRMGKLLILAIFSIFGSVGNIFMISSVMVEDHLKKAGEYTIVDIIRFKIVFRFLHCFFFGEITFSRIYPISCWKHPFDSYIFLNDANKTTKSAPGMKINLQIFLLTLA